MTPLSQKKSPSEKKWQRHFVPIVWALLVAVLVRTFLFQPFSIPSGSMLPTLLVGDHLFVSKYAYGYSRYSLPVPIHALGIKGRIFGRLPSRGDIIVFRLPSNDRLDYIKRVVGLPGDRIRMERGIVLINGARLNREYLSPVSRRSPRRNPYNARARTRNIEGALYREYLPDGASYKILETEEGSVIDTTPEYLVPEGHVFVMGDNRDNSVDSRVLQIVGFVPVEHIIGRAERLYISVDASAKWWAPWSWPGGVRWNRIWQDLRI